MNDLELKRRKVHGVLSSKSLLESLEKLTLNKNAETQQNLIEYSVRVKNSNLLSSQNSLKITEDGIENFSQKNFVENLKKINFQK